jgi:hypothetical protein
MYRTRKINKRFSQPIFQVNSINYKTPELVKRLLSPLVGLVSRRTQELLNAGPVLSRSWQLFGALAPKFFLLASLYKHVHFLV